MMSKSPHFPVKTATSPRGGGGVLGLLQWLGALLCLAAGWAQAVHAAPPQITEGFVNAAPAEVWRILTTAEGYKQAGLAQAEIDFRIGGTIRTHDDPQGRLGDARTIVQEILAYEPERMLALRIKQAPADFPHRDAVAGTWTVVYLIPAGENMTQVRIVALGHTDQPESQGLREFLSERHRTTLDRIAKGYWPKCAKCAAEETAEASSP